MSSVADVCWTLRSRFCKPTYFEKVAFTVNFSFHRSETERAGESCGTPRNSPPVRRHCPCIDSHGSHTLINPSSRLPLPAVGLATTVGTRRGGRTVKVSTRNQWDGWDGWDVSDGIGPSRDGMARTGAIFCSPRPSHHHPHHSPHEIRMCSSEPLLR